MNHVNDEIRTQKPYLYCQNNNVSDYESMGFEFDSHYYHRKNINCQGSEQTWNSKTFLKKHSGKWNKPKNDLNLSYKRISRIAGYIYQLTSCLAIRRVILPCNVSVHQRNGVTRGIRGLIGFTVQHGLPLVTLRTVTKIFMALQKTVKVLVCTYNLN